MPKPGSGSSISIILAALIVFAGGIKVGFDLKQYFDHGASSVLDTKGEPRYAPQTTMLVALEELKRLLAKDSSADEIEDMISVDDEIIQQHAYSEWSTSNSTNKPVAVIYPRSTEDVVVIAKLCSKYKVPMVPYGAGSSVEGQFSAPYSGFTMDFSRMDQILAVHEDDMDVVVQPGVNWMYLNKKLASTGLFLPLDPSPTALIGGMINTNCSGTNAMRYGTMKDWVINVTVVLPDGSVLKTRRRPRKSSAGYDLTKLFVGSEGTLGFVTEATLKLAVVPKSTGVATCSFRDVKTASAAAVKMMREGIIGLAALELMDQAQMSVINKNGGTLTKDGKTRKLWPEQPTLFLKFSGTDKSIVEDVQRVKDIAKSFGATKLEHATGDKEKDAIWAARKEALFAMVAQRDEGTEIWSTDVAVPLSRLAEIIEVSQQESSSLGLWSTVMGHVGDGNFHQSVCYHPDDPEETAKVADCVHKMMDRAMEFEGTVSGEHAIGLGKKPELEKEVGPGSMQVMRTIKNALDPSWLMNPGKVFDHTVGAGHQ
ncbi:hypothetical protein LTS08_001098 [Lithohypha guttulata]|nr:hypothetical protein LTS08_001098 [Lithohypha guttulata]